MAEEKVNFFHKILIVVVMIYAFSKLSKVDLSSLKNIFATKSEPVRYTAAPQQQTRTVIREYIPVQTRPAAPPAMMVTSPSVSRQVYHIPDTRRELRHSGTTVITPPSADTIRIDDETYRRYFS